jgi:hypothetical protein
MRVCIIGNDGIILRREPSAAVNEGEIAVTSNEEFHIAQLSSKRLLALWNALPGVEKPKKTGDREALIDQLRSAIEALPNPQPDAKGRPKKDAAVPMLRRPEGAMVGEAASVGSKTAARCKGRARSQGRDTPVSDGVGVAEGMGFEPTIRLLTV